MFWGKTQYALDIRAGQCFVGNKVILWEWDKNYNGQQWKMKNGRIESVKCPGMYIEYKGNGQNNAVAVLGNGSKNPGWTWKLASNNWWHVLNKYGKVLDIGESKAKNGATIYLYTKNGGGQSALEYAKCIVK